MRLRLLRYLRTGEHTCPWWLIWTFDNPLRRLLQDPLRVLRPFVRDGDTVLDLGCGAGYFTVSLARLVGERGRVIAADLQPRMLDLALRRAAAAGVRDRVLPHLCRPRRIGATIKVDFALAFWMAHEIGRPLPLLSEVADLLRPGARVLLAEPRIHVGGRRFRLLCRVAREARLRVVSRPRVPLSRAVVLAREP